MELKKLTQIIDNTDTNYPHTAVVFKFGDILLEPNNVTEISKDSKTLIIHLRALTKSDPAGVRLDWKIDKSVKKSQKQAIKEWLLAGQSITPLEALEMFGCFRLSAQIYELVHTDGMDIYTDNRVDERTGKRYATYSLKK